MSRVIKFRSWSKTNKRMYNRVLAGPGDPCSIVWDDERKDWLQFDDACGDLMQFTGLHDANGKEIYEGDIVATGIGPDYVKSIVRIGRGEIYINVGDDSYSRGYYGVYLERSCLEDLLLDGKMIILGNIYENPELLKKDEQP